MTDRQDTAAVQDMEEVTAVDTDGDAGGNPVLNF